jgi:hypothetical protein
MAHRHTKRCSHKRATKRSKSYRRRHTRKRGGACGSCAMRGAGRGTTAGASLASEWAGVTPGLIR